MAKPQSPKAKIEVESLDRVFCLSKHHFTVAKYKGIVSQGNLHNAGHWVTRTRETCQAVHDDLIANSRCRKTHWKRIKQQYLINSFNMSCPLREREREKERERESWRDRDFEKRQGQSQRDEDREREREGESEKDTCIRVHVRASTRGGAGVWCVCEVCTM